MLIHRLKISIRVMLRQKVFSLLNIGGLAIGTAGFLLIYSYITTELSFDQYHANKDRMYRVNMTNIWIENNDVFGSTGPAPAIAIKHDVPEIDKIARVRQQYFGSQIVSIKTPTGEYKQYDEDWILSADPDFLGIFTFPLKEGNQTTALSNPNSVVLTEEYANKYFGNQSALGQFIEIGRNEDKRSFQVTGVLQDIPTNSHFDFDILLSMNSFRDIEERSNSWYWTTFVTYLTLKDATLKENVADKIFNLPTKYIGSDRAQEKNWHLYLQKVSDIHLYSANIPNRLGTVGSINNVLIFSTVAFLILLLSCVNFMNLSTARFSERAKEVGILKVMGSSRKSIGTQFLAESMLYSFVSVFIGFGMAEISINWFSELAGSSLSINLINDPKLWLILIGLILAIGLIAGSYPSWFLSKFNLTDALQTKKNNGLSGNLRSGLIVFQFAISAALISGSFIIKSQLEYLQNRSLGFDDEHVMIIPHMEWSDDDGKLFKDQLDNSGIFESTAITNSAPPNIWNQDSFIPRNSDVHSNVAISTIKADPHFIETLKLPLIAGRNFFESGEGDRQKIIVNKKCAVLCGWISAADDPTAALGSQLGVPGNDSIVFEVVGVLDDFNFWSLDLPVEAMAIFTQNSEVYGNNYYLLGRLSAASQNEYEEAISSVQSQWNEIYGSLPFDYQFMDDQFDLAFSAQRKFGQVINVFTLLALFIASLGLIGLISFATEQRTKEFGVRKVLGASEGSLVALITKDFLKLLGVGTLLGMLISWSYSGNWLNNFTYTINISPWIWVVTVVAMTSLVILLSIAIVRRNARKNPSEILKYD
ncbi:MAG: ABC transporter permease [Cyclobacteriaceae bacterium]